MSLGMPSPYPFQRTGAAFMREQLLTRGAVANCDDMGLGKTLQALLCVPAGARLLVVCPASLRAVWKMEIRRWRKDLWPTIVRGRRAFRWPTDPETPLVMSYESLPAPPEKGKVDYASPEALTYLIYDEAHFLKNYKSKRHRSASALARKCRRAGGKVIGLTGTPLENAPLELWGTLEAIGGLAWDAFGNFGAFASLFPDRERTAYGTEWGLPGPQLAVKLRRVTIRRHKRDVLPDLPVKTWRNYPVEIGAKVRAGLNAALRELCSLGIDIEDQDSDRLYAALSGIDAFAILSKARAGLALAKVPALLDLIESYESAGEPLVVFSAHRKPIEAVGERQGWATILGGTSDAARGQTIRDFQDGRLHGVAATIRAGGVGVTLTKGCHGAFVDLDWTPTANMQAEDRLCRIGQTRGVVITRMVADHPIDRRVLEVLGEKAALVRAAVDASAVR